MRLEQNSYAIAELVPHSAPMVLLDRIIAYDSVSLQAEVTITPASMFYAADVGGVPAWVGMEYMAQAISALEGLRARGNGECIKLGFLLGTRKLLLPQKVLLDSVSYQIHVAQLLRDDSGFATFDCHILRGEQLIVAAKINVYETGKTAQELNDSDD